MNETLVASPAVLRLAFSEPIEPETARVHVLDHTEEAVEGLGDLLPEASASRVTIALPHLPPGIYDVRYLVVSAADGHAISGRFAFQIDPSETEPSLSVHPESTAPAVDAAAAASRGIAIGGLLVALGTLVLWWRGARPVLLASGADAASAAWPWGLVGVACITTFAALAIHLALLARPVIAELGGGHGGHGGAGFPLDFAAPFGWTPFALAMRLALGMSMVGFVLAVGRALAIDEARRHARLPSATTEVVLSATVAALVAAALLGMSLAAHPALRGGPIFAALDWLHLLAAGAWLGGLPAVAVLVMRAPRAGTAPRPMVVATLRRYAPISLVAALIVAATGLGESVPLLSSGLSVAGAYGGLLLSKALLFAGAVTIGTATVLLIRARIPAGGITALLTAEIVVGAVALMVAAEMLMAQPGAR